MIPSARPTIPPVVIFVFTRNCFVLRDFEKLECIDNLFENSDHYQHTCARFFSPGGGKNKKKYLTQLPKVIT